MTQLMTQPPAKKMPPIAVWDASTGACIRWSARTPRSLQYFAIHCKCNDIRPRDR
jgi:hypothetical protein